MERIDSLPGAPPAVRELLEARPLTDIRPGLERTEAMLGALGRPQGAFRSLQVAGTNGKGSVSSAMASVLAAHLGGGPAPETVPVGCYLSPHVVRFGERIQIGGQPAPDDLLEECALALMPEADRVDATHFEALTVLAFLVFAEGGVEWAAVETGMGGRLDATTVLEPAAVAVTSVSLDHEAHLGQGLAAVAREKAGVLRPGVPAVLAPQLPEAAAVLEERASEVGSPLVWLGADREATDVRPSLDGTRFSYRSERWGEALPLCTGLVGRHQAENAALALLALEAAGVEWTEEEARRGLAGLRLPGRLQVIPPAPGERGPWILDLAHNPGAMDAFLTSLEDLAPPRPWSVLCSVLEDKDWRAILDRLARVADAVTCTVSPSSPPARRWDLEAAGVHLRAPEGGERPGRGELRAETLADFTRAMERAVELAGAGTVVITGSSYLVGDVLREYELPGPSAAESG